MKTSDKAPVKGAIVDKKKVAPTAAKPKVEKVEKVKKPGVGDFVSTQILAGKDNEKILELVAAKFPDAKTTNASVNWYRSKLRLAGEEVPSSRKPKAITAVKAVVKTVVKTPAAVKKAALAKTESEGGF